MSLILSKVIFGLIRALVFPITALKVREIQYRRREIFPSQKPEVPVTHHPSWYG
ncbi:hypothetical protein L873DRAFT_1824532 [Choiromyces venosus 120613-1]|uniref:Uncharacterized protein n=1 Tax=Choiromyces venosus 120613-1 TaxID=1336337 RepID=A0A3N4J3E9_9PEZI|nr:hypothetical protein L873DRAFT_1824532 [Choiromyces venosus 120613-1]